MDKYAGGLALGAHAHGAGVDLGSALEGAVVGDVLEAVDVAGAAVHLVVAQDPEAGGVRLLPAGDLGALHAAAIERSQMHSMLADGARCAKYAAAIARAVAPGAHVLDIGAGTGLLALLAARAGAVRVTAAEMFAPLAAVAAATARENGLADVVAVHALPSTQLTAAPAKAAPLPRRADALVAEIFDSALLGEAALPAFAHAHAHLLAPDATVVPARARLVAQVVRSDLFRAFHDLGDDFPFHRRAGNHACAGVPCGTPVHAGALRDAYAPVTAPFEVFEFSFGADVCALSERRRALDVPRTAPGRADAVLVWWELDLLADGSVRYSTAPGAERWQDHWLPVVHPLPGLESMPDGESIQLAAGHDAARVWFAADPAAPGPRPCTCGFHALPGGAGRVATLGSAEYRAALRADVAAAVAAAAARGAVLDLSDGGACALLAAEAAAGDEERHIVSVETHPLTRLLYAQAARRAGAAVEFAEDLSEATRGGTVRFAAVLAEPFYYATLNRPAHTLANLLVQARALRAAGCASEETAFVPARADVVARAIRFCPGEDPFARAPAVVQGVRHLEFAKLSAAQRGPRTMHLPLFMHRYDVGSSAVLATASIACAHTLEVDARATLRVDAGEGRAAVAVSVQYNQRPPPRMAHDLVIAVPQNAVGDEGGEVSVSTTWDAENAEWRFSVQGEDGVASSS